MNTMCGYNTQQQCQTLSAMLSCECIACLCLGICWPMCAHLCVQQTCMSVYVCVVAGGAHVSVCVYERVSARVFEHLCLFVNVCVSMHLTFRACLCVCVDACICARACGQWQNKTAIYYTVTAKTKAFEMLSVV